MLNSIDDLGGEMRVSALEHGEGIFEEIRAVEEVGMVGRDTVAVRGSFPVRDNIGGDSGAIHGDGEVTPRVLVLGPALPSSSSSRALFRILVK